MDPTTIRLWTALITPMKKDGSVDFEDLEHLVRRQEAAGNGILILGSTGEGLALNRREKEEVARFVSDLKPKTGLMAGVGGFNLEEQKSWVRWCNTVEIDAFLMVSPLYSKPGPVGMERWFKALMDEADRPCMLYNIPGRTGSRITPEVIKGLAGHPSLWGLKEAGGSLEQYRAFREAVPELVIYSGDDGLLPLFAPEGCGGLVSVASNVWPEEANRYVRLCLEGESGPVDGIWTECVNTLFLVSNPIPSKVLLARKGVIRNSTLRPPLTEDELKDPAPILEADRRMTEWHARTGT